MVTLNCATSPKVEWQLDSLGDGGINFSSSILTPVMAPAALGAKPNIQEHSARASNWCKYERQGSNIDKLAKETSSDIRLPTFAGCISQASSPDPRITCTFHLFRMSHNSH